VSELSFESADAVAEQRLRRELLNRVAVTLRLSTVHELANAAMARPIRDLLTHVGSMLDGGEALRVQSIGDNFYLNNEAIKLDFTSVQSALMLRTIFKRCRINEIAFLAPPDEDELRGFLSAFQKHYRSKMPASFATERFPKIAIRAIEKAEEGALDAEIDERQNLLRNYALLSIAVRQTLDAWSAGKPPRLARLRRAIHGLADATIGHESLLVGVSRFPNLTGDVAFHLASVTALVLLMARRLGVSREVLSDLCLAALLHDAGRTELPALLEAGNSESELEAALARVPLTSVLRICAGDLSSQVLYCAAVSYEHTLRVDGGGTQAKPSSSARLVSVACAFDLLVSPRPPARGVLPDQALRIILDHSGSKFDSNVTRLFAATVGLYPVGTTVKLSGGEIGIVMEVPGDPATFAKPRVKVIRGPSGPTDYILELDRADVGVHIVESIDPIDLDLNVPHFLLA
jgi:HD-GYP domain-containing protein (c-di-GMP phosphodiesterase class II)